MTPFSALYDRAVARKGEAALEERFTAPLDPAALAAVPDDRWLSMMTRRVFQAGFVYRVIEAKWAGFEEAFGGFDPLQVAALDEGSLRGDTRIVRNGPKIAATLANALFVMDVAEAHGSFGTWVAGWPQEDIVGLWAALKKGGSRLGGDTGPRVLRGMGKATFVLTADVVAALIEHGVIDKAPTSKAALTKVQAAFNHWSEESGRDFNAISVTLACTIDSGPH